MVYASGMRWILASASPQRRLLLEGLGVRFTVVPSRVDEAACPERDPVTRAGTLALQKAKDVHASHPDAVVIGCDTLVVAPDGSLLEKPADAAEAAAMLARQSGGVSMVHSGLCLCLPGGETLADCSSSVVRFRWLAPEDIDWWVSTGQWRDRSGAFQIDGPGQLLIERVEGDWTGVVGLPVFLLGRLCAQAGLPLHSGTT